MVPNISIDDAVGWLNPKSLDKDKDEYTTNSQQMSAAPKEIYH